MTRFLELSGFADFADFAKFTKFYRGGPAILDALTCGGRGDR